MSLDANKKLFMGLLTVTIVMWGCGAGAGAQAARVIDLSTASSPDVIRLIKRGSGEKSDVQRAVRIYRPVRQKRRYRIPPGQDPFRRTRTNYIMRPGGFAPPQLCSFSWQEENGHGYRKITCKRGSRARFPANRLWDYRLFRKTARWDQSPAWQGRFYPHKLYQGDLKNIDHSRLVQGNPWQYTARSGRYRQSPRFGQHIYYPRPLWGD